MPSGAPAFPSEILEKLPEPERKRVQEFFAAAMWSGPIPNPLLSKLTPEHISAMIALASKNSDIELEDRKDYRKSFAFVLAIILASVLVLLLVLAIRDQTSLIVEILKLIAVGLGGLGGGYGIAKWRKGE